MADDWIYTEEDLGWPDILAIVLYFVVVIGVGLIVGASTFSTNIGAPMFLGLAGSAAATGMAVTMFEWHAMWMLLLLGWVFLPVYISSGCFTMPQYLKLRYGRERIRIWLSVIYTILIIISQISGQMYAGVVFIQQIFHWNIYLAIILIIACTAVYTVIGGLTAVIWTDTIQTAILIVGSFLVAGFSLAAVYSFEGMSNNFLGAATNYTYRDAALYDNRTCGFPPPDSFHIFRAADSGDYPWPGMIFGLTILALNAWCFDQTCVQRSLSARNLSHAKAGVTLAAYLKVLSFIFFIVPGMISRVLFPDEVACADPDKCQEICNNKAGCSDLAYPLLVQRILPVGVRGIMMAALLSALMSSLTSFFNSSSTVFTMDLYRQCPPRAKESEMMIVGRLWIIVLVVISTLWLPILQAVQGSNFWNYSQAIGSYLLPPVVMTFLFGMFWTRTTEQGAFAGLLVGFVVGVIRMGLEWSRTAPPCGSTEPDNRFIVVSKVHYLHFAIILAGVTSIVMIVVSLLTPARKREQLRRVTWWTRNDKEFPEASDDESDSEEEPFEKKEKSIAEETDTCINKAKYYSLKWLCGVDLKESQLEKMTKEEKLKQQAFMTSIDEDPFWKKVLDVNGLICCMAAFFLHGFWA